MIHKGTRVLVVEGPHAGSSGEVMAIRREWHQGTSTQIKMAEIETGGSIRFKARVSHIRPEMVAVESEEAKRPADIGTQAEAGTATDELLKAARDVIAWEAEYRKINNLGRNPPVVFTVLAQAADAVRRAPR